MKSQQNSFFAIVCGLFPISVGALHFIVFNGSFAQTRDQAQVCCERFGMSQRNIRSRTSNDNYASFLRLMNVNEIWLGLFYISGILRWSNGKAVSWTNFDAATNTLIQQRTNENFCFKAVLGNTGLVWMNTSCDAKLPYSCRAGVRSKRYPLTTDEAYCPKHEVYDGRKLVQEGNIIQESGKHGLFDKVKDVSDQRRQMASFELKTVEECLFKCMDESNCSGVVKLPNHCILTTL